VKVHINSMVFLIFLVLLYQMFSDGCLDRVERYFEDYILISVFNLFGVSDKVQISCDGHVPNIHSLFKAALFFGLQQYWKTNFVILNHYAHQVQNTSIKISN
jgi:hypothetical protein